MAANQKIVNTLDIQLLNAERGDVTTVKLDNPNDGITREQVSAAMQPALTNGWLLTIKGSVVMYLGDITLNTSIKTKLDGEDFYVTPSSINLTIPASQSAQSTITVSGATIQGYNLKNITNNKATYSLVIAENELSATLTITQSVISSDPLSGTLDIILVIMGTTVTIPVSFSNN